MPASSSAALNAPGYWRQAVKHTADSDRNLLALPASLQAIRLPDQAVMLIAFNAVKLDAVHAVKLDANGDR